METAQYGLKESVIEKIKTIFASYPEVEEAILYGSRAKGNFNNSSDIDFVLKGKNLNQGVLNKIRWKLDDLLLPYSIDIAIYDKIDNPELIAHIKRVGLVFYRKKNV
jgi:predicted nucleotidyltransferase